MLGETLAVIASPLMDPLLDVGHSQNGHDYNGASGVELVLGQQHDGLEHDAHDTIGKLRVVSSAASIGKSVLTSALIIYQWALQTFLRHSTNGCGRARGSTHRRIHPSDIRRSEHTELGVYTPRVTV